MNTSKRRAWLVFGLLLWGIIIVVLLIGPDTTFLRPAPPQPNDIGVSRDVTVTPSPTMQTYNSGIHVYDINTFNAYGGDCTDLVNAGAAELWSWNEPAADLPNPYVATARLIVCNMNVGPVSCQLNSTWYITGYSAINQGVAGCYSSVSSCTAPANFRESFGTSFTQPCTVGGGPTGRRYDGTYSRTTTVWPWADPLERMEVTESGGGLTLGGCSAAGSYIEVSVYCGETPPTATPVPTSPGATDTPTPTVTNTPSATSGPVTVCATATPTRGTPTVTPTRTPTGTPPTPTPTPTGTPPTPTSTPTPSNTPPLICSTATPTLTPMPTSTPGATGTPPASVEEIFAHQAATPVDYNLRNGAGGDDHFIELYSNRLQAMGGASLIITPCQVTLPDDTVILAGGKLVVWADELQDQATRLQCASLPISGTLELLAPDGEQLRQWTYPDAGAGYSALCPFVSGLCDGTATPSPGR